ncbi:MAG: hypothetical protein IJK28_02475 [Clostridia bacterium]|nr:hypothetical protein [Clostridia bacterium]
MIDTTAFFPATLKALPIWILWKLEERKGRMTKVPYQVNGRRASATDPATWTTFREADGVLQRRPGDFNGIGAVMSKANRTVFIDIDHCIDPSGNFDERAKDILDAFTDEDGDLITFVEVSQSGTGLHLIVIGDIPRSFKNSRLNVEMYSDGRFIAMTGRAFSALEPAECESGVRYVFERYKTAKNANEGISRPTPDPAARREDRWIIQHASERIGNSNKFPALFGGDWSGYGSQSEADLALCKILAFWTNEDPEAIDRIFRQSGLYRAKWERKGYSRATIEKAISENTDTIDNFIKNRRIENGLASLHALSFGAEDLDRQGTDSEKAGT